MALSGKASPGGTFPWWSWGGGVLSPALPWATKKPFPKAEQGQRGVELVTWEAGTSLDSVSKHSDLCPLAFQHSQQFSPCGSCCGSWSHEVSKG